MTHRTAFSAALLVGAVLLAPTAATSQQRAPGAAPLPDLPELPAGFCAPTWEATFGPESGAGFPSYNQGTISSSVVWDDGLGDGPVLYIGGRFNSIAGQASAAIARWDGTSWSTPPGPNFDVNAMTVHDDGSGPALFVGGSFGTAGGVSVDNLAKYDGTTWYPLGDGVSGIVFTLEAFPTGPGAEDLAIGGSFGGAGSSPTDDIVAWDGTSFYALGDGLNANVNTLEMHPPGGPAARLYAGGQFTASGGTSLSRLARFEPGSSSWVDVDGGVLGSVFDLESRNWDGDLTLLVGGDFSSVGTGVGTMAADSVASWTSSGGWTTYPAFTFSSQIRAIELFDGGSGQQIHVGSNNLNLGSGTIHTARFDGAVWQPMGASTNGVIYDTLTFDDGSGEKLWHFGQFLQAGEQGAKAIARWDGADWSATADGLAAFFITALESSSFTGLPTLYAGGYFFSPEVNTSSGIVGWRDGTWIDMGEVNSTVRAIAEFDDGSGPALYIGGEFTEIDGVSRNRIARWDGATWSDVGSGGMDQKVSALEVFDDGTGPALYAAGRFATAGGVACAGVAKWDGVTWSPLGSGLGTSFFEGLALLTWNDGGGEQLYVSGSFGAFTGAPAEGVMSWDGATWSALGTGIDSGNGRALSSWNDGSGETLYLSGSFNSVGGGVVGTKNIAAWDGSTWSALGPGLSNFVNALEVFDDGTGSALYATGANNATGDFGTLLSFIGKWDGTSWAPVGGGLNSQGMALELFDDGEGAGPRLAVGGSFTVVNDLTGSDAASNLATWGNCWGVNNWIDIGFELPGTPGAPLLVGNGSLAFGSINTVNLSNAQPSAMAGLIMGYTFNPTPFAGGILVPVPFLEPVITTTSPAGTIPISFVMPEGVPSAIAIHVQWVIADPGGPSGYAISNCVVGTTP